MYQQAPYYGINGMNVPCVGNYGFRTGTVSIRMRERQRFIYEKSC